MEIFNIFWSFFNNLPSWISALAAVASSIVAILGFRLARTSNKVAANLERIESNREFQPRYISAWLAPVSNPSFGDQFETVGLKIIIRNNSQEPIYNVIFTIYRIYKNDLSDAKAIGTEQISFVPPLQVAEKTIRPDILGEIDQEGVRLEHFRNKFQSEEAGQILADRSRILLDFTDSNGEKWMRNLNGTISKRQ